jgi:hypothetical protein
LNITDLCVLHEWYSISHHGIGLVIHSVLRPYKRSDTFFIAHKADGFRTIALRMILFLNLGIQGSYWLWLADGADLE